MGAFYTATLIRRHLALERTDEVSLLGEWIDIHRLVVGFGIDCGAAIAIVVPTRGTSFSLLWFRKMSPHVHALMIGAFVGAPGHRTLRLGQSPVAEDAILGPGAVIW
jgi:hypothetical protein